MKKAFTLAEVLITLGVIGVVAALTVPLLIQQYQKTQYVSQLKKAYTQINECLKKMTEEAGTPNDLEAAGLVGTGTSWASFGDALAKQLKLSKNCRTSANLGCWTTQTKANYDGSGGTSNYDSNTRYSFLTADGVSVYIDNYGSCGNASTGVTNNMTRTCGELFMDVNGPKKGPNCYGRDTFQFAITNGHGALLYPIGGADDSVAWRGWWKNSANGSPRSCYPGNKGGSLCAGRVIEENWQMNY